MKAPIPDSYWVEPGRLLAGEYPGARLEGQLAHGAAERASDLEPGVALPDDADPPPCVA